MGEVLAKQDNTTENASDVNLSAEAAGPWAVRSPWYRHGPWAAHPWGPLWHPRGPWARPHGPWARPPGPPFYHPHWVLAKQDNTTENGSDVNLSAQAGWWVPGPPPLAPHPLAPHPWAPHPWAPHPWAPHPWAPHPWSPAPWHLEVQDNSTENASDVNLAQQDKSTDSVNEGFPKSVEITASSTEAPRRLRR